MTIRRAELGVSHADLVSSDQISLFRESEAENIHKSFPNPRVCYTGCHW